MPGSSTYHRYRSTGRCGYCGAPNDQPRYCACSQCYIPRPRRRQAQEYALVLYTRRTQGHAPMEIACCGAWQPIESFPVRMHCCGRVFAATP